MLTAMEYLREEKVEQEEEIETCRIGIIALGESSDKTENSTEDVEVSQPIEGWPEQERKVSRVDRIKAIGKIQSWIYISPTFNTN